MANVEDEMTTEGEMKKQLELFEKTTANDIATALRNATDGNPTALLKSYREVKCPYGLASEALFQQNTMFLRLQLFTIWQGNKKGVRNEYIKLCDGEGTSAEVESFIRVKEKETTYCWCENRGFTANNYKPPPSVQCDFCNKWYHCICAGISLRAAKSLEKYKCLVCRGEMQLPELLDVTPLPNNRQELREEALKKVQKQLRLASSSSSSSDKDSKKSTTLSPIQSEKEQENKETSDERIPSTSSSESVVSLLNSPDKQTQDKSSYKDQPTEKEKADTKIQIQYDGPTSFDMNLPREDWTKVLAIPRGKMRYKIMTETYGDILNKHFNKKNQQCVLSMDKHKFIHPDDNVAGTFLKVYAHCKSKHCTGRYALHLQHSPGINDNSIRFIVRMTSGKVLHYQGDKSQRFLKGKEREDIKDQLRTHAPSKVLKKLYETADPALIKLGNRNTVKNLRVLQEAKHEKQKEEDYAVDAGTDVLITYFVQQKEEKGRIINGYIQYVSDIPFFVVMYTEKQLDFLYAVSKKTDAVIFFDGTGCLARKLPEPYEDKDLFYYAMVVRLPEKVSAMPIMEFYTNRQDVATFENILTWFLSDYKKVCNIKGRKYRIARVEVDFSKALIAAVIKTFHSVDTEGYLQKIWNGLVYEERLQRPFIMVHVCRIHVLRFWRRRLVKIFTGQQRTASIRNFWTKWIYAFINSKQMRSVCRRIVDVLTIAGCSYLTDDVKIMIEQISLPSNQCRDPVDPKLINLGEIDPNGSFSRKSPFGFYSYLVADGVKRTENATRILVQDDTEWFEPNPYTSPQLFDYVLTHVLPYTPLINHSVFTHLNLPVEADNTNPVEYFIKVLKHDHFAGATNMKVSRAIRSQLELVKGQLVRGYEATGLFPDDSHPIHVDDNADVSDYGLSLTETECEAEKAQGANEERAKSINSDADQTQNPCMHKASETQKPKTKPKKTTSMDDKKFSGTRVKKGYVGTQTSHEKSPESQMDVWGTRNKPPTREAPIPSVLDSMPLIKWSSACEYHGRQIKLLNSCNIDCTLQMLFFLYEYNNLFKAFLSKQLSPLSTLLKKIFHCIEIGQQNKAQLLWVIKILRRSVDDTIDLEETERENGTKPLKSLFTDFAQMQRCNNQKCPESKVVRTKNISLAEIRGSSPGDIRNVLLNGVVAPGACKLCGTGCLKTYRLINEAKPPAFVVYSCDSLVQSKSANGEIIWTNHAEENSIGLDHPIMGHEYKALGYTIHTGNHYFLVFFFNGKRYVYDGMRAKLETRRKYDNIGHRAISSVWLSLATEA